MTKNKKKLRLCIVADASNVHTQKHVNFLVDRGHEVHLVDDHSYSYKNLIFHHIKNLTGIRPIDYALRVKQSISTIRKIKPDVVHSLQVTYHGLIGALSGMHPFILTPWGSDILYVPHYSVYHKLITRFTVFKADILHYIDVSIPIRLRQLYGNKINEKKSFLLNEGVNTKIFSPNKNKKKGQKITIVCLRALRDSYNALLLIEALNILVNKRKEKNIKVIMLRTGDEKYKKLIFDKIKDYRLKDKIAFYDWVNHKTPEYMRKGDIYVDTIHRTNAGQGTGKTMLEAMSIGLAVVAPSNPTIDLYIKDKANGLIYKAGNAESLADKIQLLTKNKNLRSRLGKNSRKLILRNLDQRNNMKSMEKKYFEILNRNQ